MRKNETCRAARYSLRFIPSVGCRTPLCSADSFYSYNPLGNRLAPRECCARALKPKSRKFGLSPNHRCRHRLHRKECIFHILTILPPLVPSILLIGLEKGRRTGTTGEKMCDANSGWIRTSASWRRVRDK